MTNKFKKRVRERQVRGDLTYSEALLRERSASAVAHAVPPNVTGGFEPTVSRAPAVGRSANPILASEMAGAAQGKWIAKGLGVEAMGPTVNHAREAWQASVSERPQGYDPHRNTLSYTDPMRDADRDADEISIEVEAMRQDHKAGRISDEAFQTALETIGERADAMHKRRFEEARRQGMPEERLGLLPLPGARRTH